MKHFLFMFFSQLDARVTMNVHMTKLASTGNALTHVPLRDVESMQSARSVTTKPSVLVYHSTLATRSVNASAQNVSVILNVTQPLPVGMRSALTLATVPKTQSVLFETTGPPVSAERDLLEMLMARDAMLTILARKMRIVPADWPVLTRTVTTHVRKSTPVQRTLNVRSKTPFPGGQ